MTRTIARRLVMLVPILFGLSLATFSLVRLIPGDPVAVMLGEHATAEQIARFRATRGLDQPLPVQYLRYLASLAQGDWGRSIKTNLPVTTELAQRLPATAELAMAAMAMACALGIPLGLLAARRRNSAADLAVGGATLLGASLPLFWLGLMLAHLFGYRLGWLPPSGRLSIGAAVQPLNQAGLFGHAAPGTLASWLRPGLELLSNFYVLSSLLTGNWAALLDALRHLILPALTLCVVPLAVVTRITRSCLRDTLGQDHVRTARAKGLPERAVVLGHALRNAFPPILTAAGLQLGFLLSGAILVEAIFSWPGMGQLVVDRVLARDYPVVQGAVLAAALLVVAVNLATDVGCAILDPRIRHE
jgi:peptide/nickel transport system permease protein